MLILTTVSVGNNVWCHLYEDGVERRLSNEQNRHLEYGYTLEEMQQLMEEGIEVVLDNGVTVRLQCSPNDLPVITIHFPDTQQYTRFPNGQEDNGQVDELTNHLSGVHLSDGQEDGHIPDEQEDRHIPDEQEDRHIPNEQEDRHIPDEQEDGHIPDEQEDRHIPDEQGDGHIPDEQEDRHIPDEQENGHIPDEQEIDTFLTNKKMHSFLNDKKKEQQPLLVRI